MRTLVVNPGSSTLKVVLLDDGQVERSSTIDHPGPDGGLQELEQLADHLSFPDAIGVRFVHGGPAYDHPVLLDDEVLAGIEAISDLAPLHNPPAAAAARALATAFPEVPRVACFDTAFHATMPAGARTYALPREWIERWGLRRYGFHGLSHAYASRRAAELRGRPLAELRQVTCHLGGGASLCAVRGGVSVDTTMGMTPMAGLVMQTRSGSVDPGLMLHLLRARGVSADELEQALDRESGLRGLSGTSGDMREVLAAIDSGSAPATEALEVYVHRLAREIGAMAAAAEGIDVLVFTGGVGEHTPDVRRAVVARLGFLGLAIDESRNAGAAGDTDISAPSATAATVVVTAREDLEIEREVRGVLDRQ